MKRSNHIGNNSPPSDAFSFDGDVYPVVFHNNPTPQTLSNKYNHQLIDVNEAWEKFTGYKKEDVLGHTLESLNLISFYEANSIREVLTENEILKSHEIEVNRKDGDLTYGVATFQFITLDDNDYVISTIVDISELKKSRSQLSASNNFADCLLDSMSEALTVLDKDLKCIRVNKAYCELTGYQEKDVVGTKPPFPHWPPEHYDNIQSYVKKGLKGVFNRSELTMKKANGDRFKASISSTEIVDYNNETIGYVTTAVDVSERISYQNELKEKSRRSVKKKEAILKLAGLVGGELNHIFEEIAKLTATTLEIDRVSVWKFEEKNTDLTCKSAFSLRDQKFVKPSVFKAKNYPEYFTHLFESKTIRVDDVKRDQRTINLVDSYFKPLNIISTLDVLIQSRNSNYGVLCFEHLGSKKEWCNDDEQFATSISNIVALAVERDKRHEAETELTKTNYKLVALNEELEKLKRELEQENSYLREEIDLVFNYEEMVYGSKSFSQVLTDVELVAETKATVLLLGESGTGKELLARAIHNISPRKNKPLIKVNCAAIPKELIESELFGHKKGSFTGAINDKLGKFQLADGGTLFLDEIGELPLDMQPKLLRAIQESEIEQIGGTKTHQVDIRIIVATNRDLEKEVKAQNFREDLYFRINVFPINIPPLRERVEDIPILIEHFVDKYSKLYNKHIKYISDETKRNLQSYSWPGNIRELENLIERAVILSADEKLVIPNFKMSSKESLISSTVLSLDDVQRIHIKKVLKKCKSKIDGPDGAAQLLDIKPSTLRDRMKKLGISKP